MTLVVNLYGGPGTGKSTTAALLFGELKDRGVNTELVSEFAKDAVWEGRRVIMCQPYIFGKQLWRMQRLMGEVEVIVSDSPLLLGLAYSEALGPHWRRVVVDHHNEMNTVDVFLERDNVAHVYNPKGRYQKDVSEAEEVDRKILGILEHEEIPHHRVRMGRQAVSSILGLDAMQQFNLPNPPKPMLGAT